jgi:hypothetical protein
MKYKISVGAFLTVIAGRVLTVSAETEEEAIEKAKERVIRLWSKSRRVNDVGDITVDYVEQID